MILEQRTRRSSRLFVVLGAMCSLLAIGVLTRQVLSSDPHRDAIPAPVAGATPGSAGMPATSVPHAGVPATAPLIAIDYSKLRPADFVLTAESFGKNISYGKAMLAMTCDIHFKTRTELDDPTNRAVIQNVDPGGQYLRKLEFERKVEDEQCKGVSEQDVARAPELMAIAARQGDVKARSWMLTRQFQKLGEELADKGTDGTEGQARLAGMQALLPEARQLAEAGDGRAALVVSRLLLTDRYGQKNVAEAATWMLVATQVPGRDFNVNPSVFENEPFSELSPEQVAAAKDEALKKFKRCCSSGVVEEVGMSPFAKSFGS